MLEKIGGRKFLMAVLVIAAGVVIEIVGKNGLSANMVTLLGAVYATFSASNAFVTSKFKQAAAVAGAEVAEETAVEEEAPQAAPEQVNAPSLTRAELEQLLNANNAALANILNQIGAQLEKQDGVATQTLNAITSVQSASANAQKLLAVLVQRSNMTQDE